VTAAEVVDLARRQGVELFPAPEGRLRWRCRGLLPDALGELLATFKAEVLLLLSGSANVNETLLNPREVGGSADVDAVDTDGGASADAPEADYCPSCRRPLDSKRRCWKCCNRH
jgi:hypothetical protein